MSEIFQFVGSDIGQWRILSCSAIRGDALPPATQLKILPATQEAGPAAFVLNGLISNLRYANRDEVTDLRRRQEGLGRPQAARAALIPIRKTATWWALAQDERRAIFEEQSHHTQIGLDYLPGVARQLFHSRDLGEPFDFLTWFEYGPDSAGAFEDLVGRLRETAEWSYVDREVDLRLERIDGP